MTATSVKLPNAIELPLGKDIWVNKGGQLNIGFDNEFTVKLPGGQTFKAKSLRVHALLVTEAIIDETPVP